MVWPMTQTLFWARTSLAEKNSPELSGQSRISRYSSDTPQTLVFQLPLPPITWAPVRTTGETAWTRVLFFFSRVDVVQGQLHARVGPHAHAALTAWSRGRS